MISTLIKVINFFLMSRALFGGSFAAYSVFVARFLGFDWDFRAGLLMLFSVCLGYNFDRLIDLKRQNGFVPKLEFVRKSGWIYFLIALAGFSLISLVFILIDAPPFARLATLTCILISVFYAIPLLPAFSNKSLRFLRLKDIPGLKSICVAGMIAFGLISLPLAYASFDYMASMQPILILSLATFLLMFNITLVNDFPDIETDKASEVPTIPVMIGLVRTKSLLYLLDVFSISALLILCGANYLNLSKVAPLAIALGMVMMYVFVAENEKYMKTRNFYFYYERNCLIFCLPFILSF
jgi:1,4-dihydroxy-2-naphthoate octaprenyltransferase